MKLLWVHNKCGLPARETKVLTKRIKNKFYVHERDARASRGNASGHFTLWNGTNLIYPGEAQHNDPTSPYYYFKMKYEVFDPNKNKTIIIQTDEIKLWELK
ncbi:hypothetical protein SAMN05444671_1219 [Flavobacterium sp. CF108]|uniref:hypothetical protein n=1 Tax=unclassified Flavobacterium TaxID=196869 RepID=UPI0008D7020D|nr:MULTISPECIES: hypothetical protein [unclassified Flavobacterium]SEO85589.1 hypothetical protein SAMN04487978_3834 [Flavobacterium sp. fv08]SHG69723.1 hypothetical protein SAMN05444671_1219 [Flavobacterium sp. CF108]